MKSNVKKKIVDMVVNKMNETGLTPWENGFLKSGIAPINYATGKRYQGVNAFILRCFGTSSNEYVTYKQAQAEGGQVKEGQKGLPVVWYTLWNKTQKCPASDVVNEKDDEIIPYLKSSTVFEISQCEGLVSKRSKPERKEPVARINELEDWFERFKTNTGLKVIHSLDTACYVPGLHQIHIRNIDEFKSNSHYYQVLLHESVHSTGKALGRKIKNKFATKDYSKEEIVAEMGSMFLCNHFGIIKEQLDNSAAYVKSWGEHLKNNPDWLISGVATAEKAYDYMINI